MQGLRSSQTRRRGLCAKDASPRLWRLSRWLSRWRWACGRQPSRSDRSCRYPAPARSPAALPTMSPARAARSSVDSEVEPWIDVNPSNPEQHRRDLAAGPLVERRLSRPRRRRQRERRRELDACHDPEDDRLHGRHGRKRRRLPAGDRPVGLVRAERDRLPVEPLVQRRRAAVHDVRLRPCSPGEQVDERRADVERSGRRQARHGADGVQRQAIDHRRPDQPELRLRRLGSPRLPRERAGERRRLVPDERLQRPDLVRALYGRGPDVGGGASDLGSGPAGSDDRQPDRRPAERNAGRHLHRVQQREREEAPGRVRARAALDRQGRDMVRPVRHRKARDDRSHRSRDGR